MFATATLAYELGNQLAIPEAAVMRTAQQTYAFRDTGNGRLVPVPITIGARSDGFYELLSGLSEGDKVVTSANFLVDSESSMKAALEGLGTKAESGKRKVQEDTNTGRKRKADSGEQRHERPTTEVPVT